MVVLLLTGAVLLVTRVAQEPPPIITAYPRVAALRPNSGSNKLEGLTSGSGFKGRDVKDRAREDYERKRRDHPSLFLYYGIGWLLVGLILLVASIINLSSGGGNPLVLVLGMFGALGAMVGGISGIKTYLDTRRS